jgi:hypothetical protein
MPESDPLIRRTIAHYRVVERFDGCRMGVVYKAEDQTGYRGSIDHSAQSRILGLNHRQFRAHFDMLRDDRQRLSGAFSVQRQNHQADVQPRTGTSVGGGIKDC